MLKIAYKKGIDEKTKYVELKNPELFDHPQLREAQIKNIAVHGKGPHKVVKVERSSKRVCLVTFLNDQKKK